MEPRTRRRDRGRGARGRRPRAGIASGAAGVAVALLLAGCSSGSGSGTATDEGAAGPTPGPTTATTVGAPPAAEADGTTCALITTAEASDALGTSVTEKAVEGSDGCQWFGAGTVNGFRSEPGGGTKEVEAFVESYRKGGATITPISGVGDEAYFVQRPSNPIVWFLFRVGDEGMRFQSQASVEQLTAMARAAAPRL